MKIVHRALTTIRDRLASATYELTLFGQITKAFALALPISCLICARFLTGNDCWWWFPSSWIYRHIDLYSFALLLAVSLPVFLTEGLVIVGSIWIVLRAFVRHGLRRADSIAGQVHGIQ